MRNRFSFLPAAAGIIALAGLGIGVVACGDDDDGGEEDVASVQASIDAINQATLDGNVENIDQFLTEDGAKAIFFASLEDIKADPSIIAVESEDEFFVSDEIKVDGDTADAFGGIGTSDTPLQLDAPSVVEFVKEGDDWKANGFRVGDAEEPDDAVTVAMELNEFVFNFDPAEIETGKPVYFEVENIGAQVHEMALVKLEEGVVLEDALQEEEPEGVEFLGFVFGFQPGQSAKVALDPGLEAGRYAFVCFLPDTSKTNPDEQLPHAFLGMTNEFELQ